MGCCLEHYYINTHVLACRLQTYNSIFEASHLYKVTPLWFPVHGSFNSRDLMNDVLCKFECCGSERWSLYLNGIPYGPGPHKFPSHSCEVSYSFSLCSYLQHYVFFHDFLFHSLIRISFSPPFSSLVPSLNHAS
jgi:hypothetical protein